MFDKRISLSDLKEQLETLQDDHYHYLSIGEIMLLLLEPFRITMRAPEISTQEAIDKIVDKLVDMEAHKHGIEISDVKRFLREQIFR